MSTLRPSRRLVMAALALTAAGLVVGGIAYASIPDAGGVIHACYKNNQGTLRVIDSDQGQACDNSETSLNWNVKGPQGPQGPTGPAGPQGPKGDTGPTYRAGTGLGLSGDTFDIRGSYQLPQGCSLGQSPVLLGFPLTHPWSCFTAANSGEFCQQYPGASTAFVDGIDANGDIVCGSQGSSGPSGPDLFETRIPGNQDTPEQIATTLATLSLPDGSFLLSAQGFAAGDTAGDDTSLTDCHFDQGLGGAASTAYDVEFDSFSFQAAAVLTSPTDVHLICTSGLPHTHVQDVVMTALQVGDVLTQ